MEQNTISQDMQGKIDHEVKKLIDEGYRKAAEILKKNKKKLDEIAAELVKKKRSKVRSLNSLWVDQKETNLMYGSKECPYLALCSRETTITPDKRTAATKGAYASYWGRRYYIEKV